ncbi:MAG: hypothetical protein IT223_06675 [Crocinitomicaceae bacterium]|nr:hypothetical protein [Crocinitomicaceae bacterium]
MNKLYFLSCILFGSLTVTAQVRISNDNLVPDPSSGLDVDFSDKGMLMPRLADHNSISNPANGLTVFNTTDSLFYYNAGTASTPEWVALYPNPGKGDLNVNNNAVINVPAPVNGTDAVNKDYVDAAVAATGGGSGVPQELSSKSGSQLSFKDAVQYCENLTEGGNTDWRMPDFDELAYFIGSDTDPDYLWTKEKSSYDIATNQNYVSTRLSDGRWSGAGVISRFLPRTVTSSYTAQSGWTTIMTVLPTIGDLLLLPTFSLTTGPNTTSSLWGIYPDHRMTITFADGGTLVLGPYSTNGGSTVRYSFTARDMEEAWMFGPIQKIDIEQSASTAGSSGTRTAYASITMTSAYEIILSQADGGSGLYARCVR